MKSLNDILKGLSQKTGITEDDLRSGRLFLDIPSDDFLSRYPAYTGMNMSWWSDEAEMPTDAGKKAYIRRALILHTYYEKHPLGQGLSPLQWRYLRDLANDAESRPDAERGQGTVASAREGGRSKNEQNREKWSLYQDYIDRLNSDFPSLTYADLQRKAAKHFGVHQDTVKKHTINPKKVG